MADWSAHCEIISRCMGNEEDKFLKAYEENAKIQTEQVMETSQIAVCLAHFVEHRSEIQRSRHGSQIWRARPLCGVWAGVASSLKAELEVVAEHLKIDTKSKGWARNPSWLIRRINENHAHAKGRRYRNKIYDQRNAKSKIIMIRKLLSLASLASQDENDDQKETLNSDAINDCKDDTNKMASQNHAQKQANDANDANDANLHTDN